jgi:hypothetical protein
MSPSDKNKNWRQRLLVPVFVEMGRARASFLSLRRPKKDVVILSETKDPGS